MAPTTSLRLLHIAAVLVMMASSGVLPETVFPFQKMVSMFEVLRERGCQPDDFNWWSSTEARTKGNACAVKVLAKDVPVECASAPALAQFYNCYAHSMGFLVDVGGVKSFDLKKMEDRLLSFTKNKIWKQTLADSMSYCQREAQASLTPQQLAVYSFMCLQFNLFADCDRQQAKKGSLDEEASARRALFIEHGTQMAVRAIGRKSPNANVAWGQCKKLIRGGNGAKQQYADVLAANACLLKEFFNKDGMLDSDGILQLAVPELLAGGLLELVDVCGSSAAGQEQVTAEQFLQCCVTEGSFMLAAFESSQAVAFMSEACTISV